MKIPLLDLKAQLKTIETDIKRAVTEVIDSTRYIMGPKVEALEEEIAAYTGAKYGTGVSSGTDALLVSLMALNIKPGDLVITTPFSFFATAGVIARLNAQPVFVDIDLDTYNMSPDALKQWFESHAQEAQRVKAIIPVHLYGQCAHMDPSVNCPKPTASPSWKTRPRPSAPNTLQHPASEKPAAWVPWAAFPFSPAKTWAASATAAWW